MALRVEGARVICARRRANDVMRMARCRDGMAVTGGVH